MKVLVTGGTGSVGNILVHTLLKNPNVEHIRVLGRSEYRTLLFKREITDHRVEVVSGDVGDGRSLELNTEGMDAVFHCAAMKHVDLVEKDPYLAMHTNIEGTKNVVQAALRADVQRVVMMSTDKVVHASSLYGATKLVAEKVLLSANRTRPIFNIVRSGNVLNSSGSVTEIWLHQIRTGRALRITDPEMTRFYIPKRRLGDILVDALEQEPGTVIVPRSPAIRLGDLAAFFIETFADGNHPMETIGRRPGEKLHEELVSHEELPRTTEQEDAFVVHPNAVATPLWHVPSSGDRLAGPEEIRRLVLAEMQDDGTLQADERARLAVA